MRKTLSDPAQADRGDEGLPAHGRRGIDRRKDLAAWVVTPLATLLIGPVIAFCTTGIAFHYAYREPPSIGCGAHYGCYRAQTMAIVYDYVAVFLIGWLLLWCLPWWRGLRRVRILVAVLTVLPLALVPIRVLLGLPNEW